MSSIHGIIWVVLGIVIGGFAWFVERTSDKTMLFFEIAAGIFVFIGVVKVIWSSAKKKKQSSQNQQLKNQTKESVYNPKSVVLCQNCGAKHYVHSNFCHMCGSKLKKY